MNPWIVRIIIVILAIAFVPLVITGVAALTVKALNSVSHGIHNLFAPFSMRGDARLEGLIKLCLYFVAGTLLIRFLLDIGGKR